MLLDVLESSLISSHLINIKNKTISSPKLEKNFKTFDPEMLMVMQIYLAVELVSLEITYPCFKTAVTSIPLINFTTMQFLEHTESL